MENVSYIVPEILVRNETHQFLRKKIEERFSVAQDETFCGKQVSHCLLSCDRLF